MRVPDFSQLLSWSNTFGAQQVPFDLTSNAVQKPLNHAPHLPKDVFADHEPHLHTDAYIDGVRSGTTGVALSILVRQGLRNDTAPLLGGLLFEDIAQSGDGGIYGELLRNRAFQGSGIAMSHIDNIPYRSITYSENPTLPFGPVMDGWSGVGDVRLSLDMLHPVSDALPVSLQVDVLLNATGRVGIVNDGFWGMSVRPGVYNASLWVQSSGVRFNWTLTSFDVELRSAGEGVEGKLWCSERVPVVGRLGPYAMKRFEGNIECDAQAPNVNNTFAITFDAEEARGQTLYFGMMSLFPETYKGRANGLRKDLAEQIEALDPKFLRFPGGNNLEGYSVQRRWKWWKTIGPLEDRPGRPGDWTYYNTDGLGLLEYLIWCEDMHMEPLLAVYAGFSLDIAVYDAGNSTDANEAEMEQMPDVLQEALDELEYCMGNPKTTYWGRQRAKHGHPEPFNIGMIEIGNEDWFSHHYPMRAEFMYQGLKKVYPDVTYIFSSLDESKEFKMKIPQGGVWDGHVYAPAGWFIRNHNYWDNFNLSPMRERPNHPVDPPSHIPLDTFPLTTHNTLASIMEYHVSAVGINGVINRHPRMGAAVAEAVFAIGGERNPNTYRLSCFAPLIQNLNAWRGTPYDILFTSDERMSLRSVSYWQQWLFNRYPGRQTLSVVEREGVGSDGVNPLFWVASIDDDGARGVDKVYFKIVNAGNTTQILDVQLDVPFRAMNGTILAPPTQGDLFAYNTFENEAIYPREIEGVSLLNDDEGEQLRRVIWTVPAFSISVLQFDLYKSYPRASGGSPKTGLDEEAERTGRNESQDGGDEL